MLFAVSFKKRENIQVKDTVDTVKFRMDFGIKDYMGRIPKTEL